jgi:hypothetical protein
MKKLNKTPRFLLSWVLVTISLPCVPAISLTLSAPFSNPFTPALAFTEQQKVTAGDGAPGDEFGFIAISGSTVVIGSDLDDVGANVDQGSAYVFERQGHQLIQQQKLIAGDGGSFDLFGYAVAISGSTMVLGAYKDDVGSNVDQGSAYVFERQGDQWVEKAKLTASDGAAADEFGVATAIAGKTIVVSARGDDVGGNVEQGSVYVFERQGGIWVEQQKLIASDGGAGDIFGESIALNGSTLVIGAEFDDIAGNNEQGSAYVFERRGGTWSEQQKLTASDGSAGGVLGASVGISDSTIVVSSLGAAYVFERHGGNWIEEQKLTATDASVSDFFAYPVAVSGSTIVVGAHRHNANQGAAYVFRQEGGAWVQTQKLVASDAQAGDGFGRTVVTHGGLIMVGAPFDENPDQGSAYLFTP